jgi:lipoyl-dependent peroxiredoxin
MPFGVKTNHLYPPHFMNRLATAVWQGSGKDGHGTLSAASHVLNNTGFSFKARFENEDGSQGTNPEELIAAAHAGCFSMKLAFNLQAEGHNAEQIETVCTITMLEGAITASHLKVSAKVPGLDEAKFDGLIQDAKVNCPVSKVLNAEVSMDYTFSN